MSRPQLTAYGLERLDAGNIQAENKPMCGLTKRELECICWSANGKTAWEIALILGISEWTVTFHVENTKAKLGASTLTHAAAIAVAKGFVEVQIPTQNNGAEATGK